MPKRPSRRAERAERTLTLTRGFYLYLGLLAFALLFTQALRSPASSLFFAFLALLPLAMLGYVLAARASLRIFMLSDSQTVEKNTPFSYEFRLINEFILPYPFTQAALALPQENSVRCRERAVHIAMPPASSYTVKNTVAFPFRGTYEIGVRALYVEDLFRLFRMRIDFDNYATVYVLPRRRDRDAENANAVSDSPEISQKSIYAVDKTEVEDVRDYQNGDPLKSIHWKLSSKAEEFIVRDYSTGGTKNTFLYCDLAARFPTEAPARPPEDSATEKKKRRPDRIPTAADPDIVELSDEAVAAHNAEAERRADSTRRRTAKPEKGKKGKKRTSTAEPSEKRAPAVNFDTLAKEAYYEDMNEFCADGVIELCCSTVLRELRRGNVVTLLWYDRRSESGVFGYTLRGESDFDTIFKLFATAPLSPADKHVTGLAALPERERQNTKQIFITAAMDEEAVTLFSNMPTDAADTSGAGVQVILYDPEERFADLAARRSYIEACRAQLAARGFLLTDIASLA